MGCILRTVGYALGRRPAGRAVRGAAIAVIGLVGYAAFAPQDAGAGSVAEHPRMVFHLDGHMTHAPADLKDRMAR